MEGTKIESAAAEPESLGRPEMANKVRQAIVKDRREISAGKGDQGAKPSRVCSHHEGKAGREGKRQAVC